jgi:hypothetical protein
LRYFGSKSPKKNRLTDPGWKGGGKNPAKVVITPAPVRKSSVNLLQSSDMLVRNPVPLLHKSVFYEILLHFACFYAVFWHIDGPKRK